MTFLLILLALAVVSVAVTLRDVFGDRGRPKAPTSHFEDPMFRSPAGRL